ncbi:MAG: hypothetical protein PHE55_13810 [Methylococcaceae bacterium]|nr:hypothetical protein [Methylococcaceae bacterium]
MISPWRGRGDDEAVDGREAIARSYKDVFTARLASPSPSPQDSIGITLNRTPPLAWLLALPGICVTLERHYHSSHFHVADTERIP